MTTAPADLDVEQRRLVDALTAIDRVLIIGHVGPDADALGSALGLAQSLRAAGKDVAVSVGEPGFTVPRSLAWLPAVELLRRPEEVPADPDAVIAVDCAALDRLGVLAPLAQAAPVFAVIDHHRSNPGFAGINVVDPSAAATSVLVGQIIDEAKLPWTPQIADDLYAALASDTGGFRYANTDIRAHQWAITFMQRGADATAVSRHLFDSRPWAVVQVKGQVIASTQLDQDAAGGVGLALATVSAEQRREAGVHYDDLDPVISDLVAIAEAGVAVLVKQDDHHRWKVSLRSKGSVDVGSFASQRGGGGHTMAAGYTADSASLDDVVTDLRGSLGSEEYKLR